MIYCDKCRTENSPAAIYCQQCANRLSSSRIFDGSPQKSSSPRKTWAPWAWVAGILIIGYLLNGTTAEFRESDPTPSQTSTSWSKATPTAIQTEEEAPWFPDGYKEITSVVAYKPFEKGKMDCGYSSAHSCYEIYVVTKVSCKLYVRVNFLVDGVVIDDGLDSANVAAGEKAILEFASFKASDYSGSKKVKFTEVTCY